MWALRTLPERVETVCGEAEFGGYTKNGGFAEYVIADPNYVAHIPAGLDPKQAAPLICAGITSYKGIKETKTKPGDWIVISGAGGLGHLAIQYAKVMGLQVCAVDIDDAKLALAKTMGADLVVNAMHGDAAEAVKKGTNGGAHGVLITAPSLSAFKQGIGRIVQADGTVKVAEDGPVGQEQFPDRYAMRHCPGSPLRKPKRGKAGASKFEGVLTQCKWGSGKMAAHFP